MRRRSVGTPFINAGRREAARACAYGPRTAGDVARHLAKERGSVTTALDQLEAAGVLRAATVTHSKGKAYELVGRWRRALERAVGSANPRGLLEPGLRILVVASGDVAALHRVLPDVAALANLVWCARVDGQARLLVAARSETPAERDQVDRLESILASAGVTCIQLRVDQVLELGEVDRYARRISTASRPPSLPSGDA